MYFSHGCIKRRVYISPRQRNANVQTIRVSDLISLDGYGPQDSPPPHPLTSVGSAPTENLNPWITQSPPLPWALSNFESLPSPPPSAHPPVSHSISASVRPQPVFLTAREHASTGPTTHLDQEPKPEPATSRCRLPECGATITGDVAARLSGFCSHRHMQSAINMRIATPCPKCGIRACPEGRTSCSAADCANRRHRSDTPLFEKVINIVIRTFCLREFRTFELSQGTNY
ncbi:hypothetical protein EDB83DRAFT_2441410 [Lactarius deliciosus]|nr:hypothetical protein EDB83DRAFT_2441410 [Lactarius deliciosus]